MEVRLQNGTTALCRSITVKQIDEIESRRVNVMSAMEVMVRWEDLQ